MHVGNILTYTISYSCTHVRTEYKYRLGQMDESYQTGLKWYMKEGMLIQKQCRSSRCDPTHPVSFINNK